MIFQWGTEENQYYVGGSLIFKQNLNKAAEKLTTSTSQLVISTLGLGEHLQLH